MKQRERQLPCSQEKDNNSELFKEEGRRVALSRKMAKNEALPKGWRRVKLGELCSDISYGYTATASSKPIGPKFLRITDIVSDRINWESVPYCEIEDSKKDKYTLGIGDIVIARTGATTGYNQIIRSNVRSVFASYLIRCKLKQSIAYPFFISCVLQSAYWRNFIEGVKARSAQPGVNAKDFSSFRILLPTLPEQKAIASLLETWDTAIEKNEALIAAKERQFKWLLKTLISDQPDDPEWRKVTLGEFGTFYKGKGITKADLVECGVPCLRYAEIYTKYDGLVNELSSSVSPDAATKATPIQSGDIIFAASGETAAEIGKAIAFVGRYPAVAGGDTVIFRDHGQEPAYLAHMLNSADAARQKARLGKGQSVVHIHVPELFQVEVSLPSLHEQHKIVKILATWETAIEKTKALAEQYRTQKRGLMQKLLTGKWRIQTGDN